MNGIADDELLVAALVGYQVQLRTIDERIHEIRQELGGTAQVAVAFDSATPKRRTMSAAGKARVIAALKKRWAAFYKEKAPKPPAKKWKMSAAGRKAIIGATKKRWAAYRAVDANQKPVTDAKPKREFSKAALAALRANAAKARAAKMAKKTAA